MALFDSVNTRTFQILNVIATALILVMNSLATFTNLVGNKSTGEISNEHPTFIVPAGPAFIIWALIFVFLLLHSIYIWVPRESVRNVLRAITPFYFINGLSNAAWLWAWGFESLIAAEILILIVFLTLTGIYYQLGKFTPPSSLFSWLFLHVPFSIYFGWITAATTANTFVVAFSLHGEGLEGGPDGYNAHAAIGGIAVIGLVGVLITSILQRKDWVYGLTLTWAVSWIAVGQKMNSNTVYVVALVAAGFLGGISVGSFLKKAMDSWTERKQCQQQFPLWDSDQNNSNIEEEPLA